MLYCLDSRVIDIGTCALEHDIWNVDSIRLRLCQRLEARRTRRTLRSGESRQRIRQGWRGEEGARTTMELGTGDQLDVFIGDRQLETLLSKERLRRSGSVI